MISGAKYTDMEKMIGRCSGNNQTANEQFADGCLAAPYFTLMCFNCGFVLIATALCAAFATEAKGSGIPEIKCFLNGIKRRGWLNLKTMIVKVLGVLFSVSATMPVGKEGPMIHSGAIVGAGMPQFKSTQFGFDFKMLTFRNDHYKRDFTAAGAAAGVAAAFGAPIGGVLFSLEEGASHWNQALTWRTLLTSVLALFTLRIFLSGTADSKQPSATSGWGRVSSTGLVDFGVSSVQSQPCYSHSPRPRPV
jgi:H+/Cl- antiporter ClcA